MKKMKEDLLKRYGFNKGEFLYLQEEYREGRLSLRSNVINHEFDNWYAGYVAQRVSDDDYNSYSTLGAWAGMKKTTLMFKKL